ncbi:hypothetical protein GN244_ATG08423 [Phytophthora infestans]|uniref:Uncharacterized protein n=1 Tax=Phytophthora infestans TaxID=4787 RepID=A0A833SVD9_PHYIN|nr:hypothetical protein GN244_ATG08423 [Phytophthora infestans]
MPLSTLRVTWQKHQLYLEVSSNFKGEALWWLGIIVGSIPEPGQAMDGLAQLLLAIYNVQRSTSEVVDRLSSRRQMISEKIERTNRGIEEERSIDAFLSGIQSEQSATSVQGHYAQTLDETVRIKASQVGEYGEGYRVGLEASTGKQTGRGTVVEVAPQQATAAPTAVRGQTPRVSPWRLVVAAYEGVLEVPTPTYRYKRISTNPISLRLVLMATIRGPVTQTPTAEPTTRRYRRSERQAFRQGLANYGLRQLLMTKEDRLRSFRRFQESIKNRAVDRFKPGDQGVLTDQLSYDGGFQKEGMEEDGGANQNQNDNSDNAAGLDNA